LLVRSATEIAIGNKELKKLSPYSFPVTVGSSELSNKGSENLFVEHTLGRGPKETITSSTEAQART